MKSAQGVKGNIPIGWSAQGNYPAVEYARASLARNIIRSRVEAGLTQLELAKLAGIRNETLCRIERGQHTPSVATIARVEKALKQASARKRNGRRRWVNPADR